jgi:hypothetical protein
MRIAVVQHKLRGEGYADADALVEAARGAAEDGAEFVFFPEVDSLGDDYGGPRAQFLTQLHDLDIGSLAPNPVTRKSGEDVVLVELGPLGKAVLLSGDAPADPEVHKGINDLEPDIIVMLGRSESELQAEALVEVAIGLSESATGLVVLLDASGAELGEPGHGGSAVAMHGEVVAEAVQDDEVIMADIPAPVPGPQTREALPTVPPILTQRLAFHRGVKPEADYPAELT